MLCDEAVFRMTVCVLLLLLHEMSFNARRLRDFVSLVRPSMAKRWRMGDSLRVPSTSVYTLCKRHALRWMFGSFLRWIKMLRLCLTYAEFSTSVFSGSGRTYSTELDHPVWPTWLAVPRIEQLFVLRRHGAMMCRTACDGTVRHRNV